MKKLIESPKKKKNAARSNKWVQQGFKIPDQYTKPPVCVYTWTITNGK